MIDRIDPRKEKRICRYMGLTALYEAYNLGCENGLRREPRPNPFPKGKRHDEFNRGQFNSDPMGDYMGRNA